MATATNKILDYALEYAERGWQVVPLYGIKADGSCECSRGSGCESAGKHPRIKEWQKNATTDEATIEQWWGRWPGSNLGVQLGEASGIIDIECDSEEGHQRLLELFGGEMPPTLCFKSGRGTHYLFKWQDDLPGGANVPLDGIDLKLGNGAKGSQSVFPPSVHATKGEYRWLLDSNNADLEELPDEVVARLWNWTGEELNKAGGAKEERPPSIRHQLVEQKEIKEGSRDNILYSEACGLWEEKYKAYGSSCFEDPRTQTRVYEMLWSWNKAKFVPPLDDSEVRKKCEGAMAFIRSAKQRESSTGPSLTALGLEYKDGEWAPGEWFVETINSDPRIFRLHAPFLPREYVDLTSDEYNSPAKVHAAVLEETMGVCLDDGLRPWQTIWKGSKPKKKEGGGFSEGKRGLFAKLLDNRKEIEAPEEIKQANVCADFLLNYLSRNMRTFEDNEPLPTSGQPFRKADGTTWFSFDKLLTEAQFERSEYLNRKTLSKAVRTFGGSSRVVTARGNQKRMMVIDQGGISKLKTFVVGQEKSHG